MAFIAAGKVDDLWDGEMVGRVLAGLPVLLLHVEGRIRAYVDRCAHLGVPLSKGRLSGRVLTCSAHEWQYDACTGQGLNPRTARLRALPVRIEGGEIQVDVDAPAPGAPGWGGGG